MKKSPGTLKWMDGGKYIEIEVPDDFSFAECLVYLNRSELECLHKVKDNELYKFVKYEDLSVLVKIGVTNKNIRVTFLNTNPSESVKAYMAKYIWDMFDLATDLTSFYKKAKDDKILNLLINKFRGLRIVKINELFEGLCWAIIGQQINLKFAYTLKKRLVEQYGEKLSFDGEDYFVFPTEEKIAQLRVEDLRELQFTQRKAEYLIGVAKLFAEGTISAEELSLEQDYEVLHKKLVSIRGIGNWTADYTIMKCFKLNCAFPIADVGIHNSLKSILHLKEKPSMDEIQKMVHNWQGWESYAAFYLWRYLYY